MVSGRCERIEDLPAAVAEVLHEARRAVMTTIDPHGAPHAVPVIFAVHEGDLVTPIDRKPKTGRTLGRRRNLEQDPRVTLLADRWSEEWTELAWVMVRGRASFVPPERSGSEVAAIIARHPRYRAELEDNEVIRIAPERISWWSWS
jgi:PPOX class probable F420-dependent enzyme